MSKPSKNILYISSTRLWVNGEDPAYVWTPENIEEILLDIKSKLGGKSVRILFDDSVTYMVNLSVPSDQPLFPLEIIQKVQKQVPEIIENGFWDYKLSRDKDTRHIQAFVIKKNIITPLAEGLLESDIQVEASEPVSLSLARLSASEASPHIIIYTFSGSPTSFILADKGEVFSAICVPQAATEEKIERFINFCIEKYNIRPEKILLSQNVELQTSQIADIPVGKVDLNPLKGIKLKKDIKGDNEKVLSIDSGKLLRPILLPPAEEEVKSVKRSRKAKIGILAGLTVVGLLFFGGMVVYRAQNPIEQKPAETSLPSVATPAPTPLISLSDYSFQILNGTGKAGEAAAVRDLLGLPSADIGNAGTKDAESTLVKLKKNLAAGVYDVIEQKLAGKYTVEKQEQLLDQDSKYDIIVIVGTSH